jgi:hypothetical protein
VANSVYATRTGDAMISARMIGTSPTQAEPKYLGWGKGGTGTGSPYAAAKTDVAPFQESAETRVTGSSSQQTTNYADDTYQVTATITSLSTQTIAEVFLADSATKPFSTTVAGGTVVGSSSGTTLTTATTYTPANATYIQIDTEVLEVTAGTGTTSLTVARAQNGSTAISTISDGDVVTCGNPPPPGSTTGTGNLFVHAAFSGLPLSTGDSLFSTVQVAFN